jgi:Tol biopolymer transport system component
VWPLIEESVRARGVISVETIPYEMSVVIPPTPVTSLARIPTAVAAPRRRRPGLLAALAIPALLAIGVTPVLWEWRVSNGAGSPDTVNVPTAAPSAAALTIDTSSRAVPGAGPDALDGQPAVEPIDRAVEASPARGISDGPTYSPAFASAGSAMFYHGDSGSHSALMRADTDGRGAVLRITSIVDDRTHNFHVRPSPDETRIAFDSDRDGERAVYVANADGHDVKRVSGEGFAAVPSWSPDGRTIAFVRAEPDRPKVWNLWTADLSTGAMRRLTSYRYGQPWGGSWFPDGRRIAYSHEQRLVILDLTNGKERIYPSPMKGRLVRTPAVSPDGARVMFQVRHDGAWMLELRNGSMRRVLADPSAEEYTWSPDGRRVAYHSRSAGTWGVWVMAAR